MTLRKANRKDTSHTLKSQFHWGRVIQYVVAEGEKDKRAASSGQNGVSWFKRSRFWVVVEIVREHIVTQNNVLHNQGNCRIPQMNEQI